MKVITARKLAAMYNMLQDYAGLYSRDLYEWDDENRLWFDGESHDVNRWFDQSRLWMIGQLAPDLLAQAVMKVTDNADFCDVDPWEYDSAIFEAIHDRLIELGGKSLHDKHEDDGLI